MHEIRSSLQNRERRVPLATKGAPGPTARTGGSLSGISIKREESRRSDQRREGRQFQVVERATITYQRRRHDVGVLNVSSRGGTA